MIQERKIFKLLRNIIQIVPLYISVLQYYAANNALVRNGLTLLCKMSKNGQTYFKNLVVLSPQDFESMFGHFSALCMKGLNRAYFWQQNHHISHLLCFILQAIPQPVFIGSKLPIEILEQGGKYVQS